jgi:hypothetical protein
MAEPGSAIPWAELEGGYRTPYDPRPALAALEAGQGDWDELWQELHHQGDVGLASYAAVPQIACIAEQAAVPDWNPFALVAVIEEARLSGRNPALPDWLKNDYETAWERLFVVAHGLLPDAAEDELIRSLFSVIAFGKSQPLLARLALLTEAEHRDMLDEVGGD